MRFPRSCGTLVHPTSFPTPYGIGDLGPSAYRFIDFLVETEQSIWQILPLGPTGYGNSPYTSYSAFAGNHYLLSPDRLVEKGLLTERDAVAAHLPMDTEVRYEEAFAGKDELFHKAAKAFYGNLDEGRKKALEAFKEENAYWLEDYVYFMAALNRYGKKPWNQWDDELTGRDAKALKKLAKEAEEEIDYHYWLQFEFFHQWNELRSYANEKGIRVVGDIPIFVDHNSADVWSHPEYFEVDDNGNRTLVAGVPPDYFSETGQLWGNPLYNWKALEKDGFEWWVQRFKQMFSMYDAIRVDHFRGFEAYWEVKASEKTAVNGRWVKGPGEALFDTIKERLGELPIIAEDLGVITEGVEKLRDKYRFPGMKILQFAFDGDATNAFLPHNYHPNCVVYTGTHDNDTTLGWYYSAPEHEKHKAHEYTRSDGHEINWQLIRLGMLSVADQAIFPLQDYMNLDTEHRMNFPGKAAGNWLWRYTPGMLEQVDRGRIRYLAGLSNREASKIKESK